MDYQKQLLLQNVHKFNILPVTSVCNTSCIFCSHKQNPGNLQVYSFGSLSMETIDLLLSFLDKNKKIIIGESATRLIEGEPFCNPNFKEILSKLRRTFPDTPLSITTNGIILDDEWFKFLTDIKPLEINYSINCINPKNRKIIMGSRVTNNPEYVLGKLASHSINYHGSLVAMNWLTGWEELEETIALVDKNAGSTIRVFLPGHTKLAPQSLRFPQSYEYELRDSVEKLRTRYSIPITLEPSLITNLEPEVIGVIKNSPAALCGIIKGDIIKQVDGVNVLTRYDAFSLVRKKANTNLKLLRKGTGIHIEMLKAAGEASGLVMDYDIDSSIREDIRRICIRNRRKKIWIMASKLGAPILRELLKDMDAEAEVVETENLFFGGSIVCAGLLTVDDFLMAYEKIRARAAQGNVLVLPAIAFDQQGRDLTGCYYHEVEKETGISTILL
ncbi:radical SAM protein [Desulfitibacter alkalitolerans]|uniref:radical SAM protein n=1 Tax=Desulfitibacter alkalitolerans TaxID=264641 RepID=UPI000481AAF0|nr:radical SAM protein [Desulfitibacter alkalitolerans]